jgi:hypothetical protein
VLSYQRTVRVALARDAKATTASASILMQEVFRWQRRQAKRAGLREVRTGSVVFSQRFGPLLNLSIHHHAVVPDGVFTTGEDAPRFERQAAPRLEELARVFTHREADAADALAARAARLAGC